MPSKRFKEGRWKWEARLHYKGEAFYKGLYDTWEEARIMELENLLDLANSELIDLENKVNYGVMAD